MKTGRILLESFDCRAPWVTIFDFGMDVVQSRQCIKMHVKECVVCT